MPVAHDVPVSPCQLEQLPPHSLDMTRRCEIRNRLLPFTQRRRQLLHDLPCGRGQAEELLAPLGGDGSDPRPSETEQRLLRTRREQDATRRRLTRDHRASKAWEGRAQDDEAVLDYEQRRSRKRVAKVRHPGLDLDRGTSGKDLGGLLNLRRRETFEQAVQSATRLFGHPFFVSSCYIPLTPADEERRGVQTWVRLFTSVRNTPSASSDEGSADQDLLGAADVG